MTLGSEASRDPSRSRLLDGAVAVKEGASRRLFGIRHHGRSILFDGTDTVSVALTLSQTHGVEWRQDSRTRSDAPRVGLSSLMPPGVPIRVSTRGACRLLRLDLPWSEFKDWLAEDFEVDPDRVHLEPAFQADDPTLASLLYRAMAEGGGEDALRSIAAHLFARHARTGGGGRQSRRERGGLTPAKVRCVQDVIEAAVEGSPSISELAGAVGLSPFHFAREFEQTVGEPPHRFILRKRVDRAIALMADPALTIEEVAKRSGFSHRSHLARQMRRVTGLSPATFRERVLP